MLKKQTVWLLTMLSLMVVLSVYYMSSPNSGDLAYIDQGKDASEETSGKAKANDKDGAKETNKAEVSEVKNVGQDEMFTTFRMKLEDERSRKQDRLNDVIASSSASTDEKNQALEDINSLEAASTKETILQDSIMGAKKDFEDVLVRKEDDKVHVHVKTNELSKEEVVNIMQLVRDEFGEMNVDVNFQPKEG